MTMPADITSDTAWDRLLISLRAQYRDIDRLYHHVTDTKETTDKPRTPREAEPMAEHRFYPFFDNDDRTAELEQEERTRLDAETDGRLDGDYDTDPINEPGLED